MSRASELASSRLASRGRIIESISSIILILTPPLAGLLYGIDPTIVYPLSVVLIGLSILISYRFAPQRDPVLI